AALSRNRFRIHGIQIGNSAFSRTVHSDGRLGSGRLPVVGAAEGAVADLDAVDAKAVSAERSDGAATSVHQSPADRSPTAGQEDPAEEAHLWPHQARPSAQAPHPGEDG